ncbi:rabGTPase-activating protein [Strigomonas culicis]|uniref:RabGTPase-activating protein n=1 Tax=Strigomonas culicis TaxID=28005 RepID=S9UEZ6_9TRYP|nr:rabGTPase-activating protein [Strigomonas culicis]|eukprot:EPY27483.1 rabGTPase-activating protein [Strigomonas culicis]
MEELAFFTKCIRDDKMPSCLARDTLNFNRTFFRGDDRLSFTRWSFLLGIYPPSSVNGGVQQYADLCRNHIADLQASGNRLWKNVVRTEHTDSVPLEEKKKGRLKFDQSSSSDSDAASMGGTDMNPLRPVQESEYAREFVLRGIRKEAHKDVERLFWEPSLFDRSQTRKDIEDILIMYCVQNACDYKQGMHEVVALCYYAAHRDADLLGSSSWTVVSKDAILPAEVHLMREVLLFSYTEIVSLVYAVFAALMAGHLSLKHFFFRNPENEDLDVLRCAKRVQSELLLSLDPSLHQLLNTTYQIESGCYLVRWLRVLFIREFSLFQTVFIWEVLFAECCIYHLQHRAYSLCDGFAAALAARMIHHVKQVLIKGADTALRCLVTYPPVDTIMPLIENAVRHTEGPIQAYVVYRTPALDDYPRVQQRHQMGGRCRPSREHIEFYGERLDSIARKMENYRVANLDKRDGIHLLPENDSAFYEALAEIKKMRDTFLYDMGD